MKMKIIYLISILFFSISAFAQSANSYTNDEIARMKFAVHLITYDTIGGWENAAGEAYYNIVISSFNENLTIPEISSSNFTVKDKSQVDEIIRQLNMLKQNPPTWDDLLKGQTKYLIYLDRALRRNTKYKMAINP
jgi:hypothetical protein